MARKRTPAAKKNDIRSVANAAGVSISTVSRVINNTKPVSEELRKQVMRVIERRNYVPNHTARSMVYRRTETIGIVIPAVSASFHSRALTGIMRVIGASGRQSLVCTVGEDASDEVRYLNLFSRGVADGIVLMHESQNARIVDALSRVRIPVVLASVDIRKPMFPGVGIDDVRAAFEATSYLLSLGHRRVGLIAGKELTVGNFRTLGYRRALAAAGVAYERNLVVHGSYSAESGYEAARKLCAVNEDLTAIFAVSDEMAMGAMRMLKDSGRSVPGSVSVMGFDDIDLASYCDPPLSTVRQPIEEIGKRAGALLIDMIEGRSAPAERITLDHQILRRASTAAPRSADVAAKRT